MLFFAPADPEPWVMPPREAVATAGTPNFTLETGARKPPKHFPVPFQSLSTVMVSQNTTKQDFKKPL
jgi:hypothetical protein